jgi:hypothetical protein
MNSIPELTIAVAALSLLAFCTSSWAMFSAARARRHNKLLVAQIEAAQEQAKLAATAGNEAAQQLRRLKRRCRLLADRLAAVELLTAGRSYDQAIDWVRRGAKPEALTQNFGLSRGEAELVTALHANKKKTA